jgi:hypothetical protein
LPANILRKADGESYMQPDDSTLLLLKIEDKKKFEDIITYIYAGSDASAIHKPITVYKERNASAYLVAGRYVGVSETHLKYKPLSEEECKIVLEKLGANKVVRFLSDEPQAT